MSYFARAVAGDFQLSRIVLKHRGWVATALVGVTCAAVIICVARLRFESGLREMLVASAQVKNGSSPQAHFPEPSELAVLIEGDVRAPENRARIRALEQALEAIEIEAERESGANVARAKTSPLSDDADRIVIDRIRSGLDTSAPGASTGSDQAQREHSRSRLEHSGQPALVDAAGRHAAIVLFTRPLTDDEAVRLCEAVKATLERFRTPHLHLSALGIPVLKSDMTTLLFRDMRRLFGVSQVAVFVVLAVAFSHPLAVIAPPLIVTLSILLTFAVMAATGVPVTLMALYLPGFLACVAVGDAVHIQSMYHRLHTSGCSRQDAIVGALRSTSRPIVYTALTTSCGLLGLCAASTKALRQLGIFASLGIMFAMLLSFLIVPIILSFHRGRPFRVGAYETGPHEDRLNRFLLRAASLTAPQVTRARLRLVVVMVSLLSLFGLSIAGISRLRVEHDTLDFLPRDSELRTSVHTFDQFLGGTVPIGLVIAAPRGTFAHDSEFLARLERLRELLLAYDAGHGEARLVTSATGIAQALDELASVAGERGLPIARPWDNGEVADLFTLLEIAEPTALRDWMSLDSQQTMMRLQLRWTDATAYEPFLAYAQAAVAKTFGAETHCHFIGPGYEMVALLSSLLDDLHGSFILAFLLEAITLALFLRRVRLSLIAMLPNLLPVLMVLGIMGFLGMRVDIHTLLLAPIALGIVTDDTAHFMHSVRHRIAATGDVERALTETLREVGRAIVINGAALTAFFGIYLAGSMQSMQKVGVLVMLTIVLSLLADLMFTPALIRIAFRGYGRVLA